MSNVDNPKMKYQYTRYILRLCSCRDDCKMQPQFLQHVTFESLEVNVKPSQRKHRTFSWSTNGNLLLARLAPLCSFPEWDLEVFGELPISSCEMSIVALLLAPICWLRLIDLPSSSLVDFGAPTRYTFSATSSNVCIPSTIVARSKVPDPCSRH